MAALISSRIRVPPIGDRRLMTVDVSILSVARPAYSNTVMIPWSDFAPSPKAAENADVHVVNPDNFFNSARDVSFNNSINGLTLRFLNSKVPSQRVLIIAFSAMKGGK